MDMRRRPSINAINLKAEGVYNKRRDKLFCLPSGTCTANHIKVVARPRVGVIGELEHDILKDDQRRYPSYATTVYIITLGTVGVIRKSLTD